MIIVGDIGNTETKICLINSNNKIIKRIILDTKKINIFSLKELTSTFNLKKKLLQNVYFVVLYQNLKL